METIGELLRRVREEKDIPLEEVAKITRIRKTYLEALEENNKSVLPGEAYYKAFIRSYAVCLGLDFEELKKEYFFEESQEKKIGRKPEVVKDPIENFNKNAIVTIYDQIWSNKFFRIALLLIIVFLFLYLLSTKQSTVTETKNEITKVEKSQENLNTEPVQNTEKVQVENIQKIEKEKTVPQPVEVVAKQKKDESFTLTLTGFETTWVRVKVDDKENYNVYIKPEEKKLFIAEKKFELKLGNAAGVKVKINDKDQPPLGKRGAVIDNVIFLKENFNKEIKK